MRGILVGIDDIRFTPDDTQARSIRRAAHGKFVRWDAPIQNRARGVKTAVDTRSRR